MTRAHDKDSRESERRVIDALAQRDQIIEEARMLPFDGDLTQDQIDHARDTLGAYLTSKKLTIDDVAKQTSRSASSITQFLDNAYRGDNSRLARLIVAWVEQHARGETSGMPSGYISTAVTRRMYAVMRKVHSTRTVGLIVGPAGVSKSVMCESAASGLIPGAVHIECVSGSHSASQFAKMWARRLGCGSTGALGVVEEAIIKRLRGTDRLQLIDEAFYLSRAALNVVRDVHKQAHVPIVLIGTRDVEEAVDDARLWYGQWTRLISLRYDILEDQQMDGQPLFTVDDIHRFASKMGLKLTGAGAERATEIACIPAFGGLGILSVILLNASILCESDRRKSITDHDIIDAYESMSGARYRERLEVNRAEFVSAVRIA